MKLQQQKHRLRNSALGLLGLVSSCSTNTLPVVELEIRQDPEWNCTMSSVSQDEFIFLAEDHVYNRRMIGRIVFTNHGPEYSATVKSSLQNIMAPAEVQTVIRGCYEELMPDVIDYLKTNSEIN